MSAPIYAVMGASGQTGGATARELLRHGCKVRVLARKPEAVADLVKAGAEFASVDNKDVKSLTAAFQGVAAAYIMNPPGYMAEDLFKDADEKTAIIKAAIVAANVKKIVVLTGFGTHLSTGLGNIFTIKALEKEMRTLPIDVGVLRPCYFMENLKSVAGLAKDNGILPCMLLPLDAPADFVSTEDIGRVAAEMLISDKKNQVIELCGPAKVSPNEIAAIFAKALGKPVTAVPVPTSEFPNALKGFAPKTISAFAEMMEGINSGYIQAEHSEDVVRGVVPIETVVKTMLG